ncbi:MAG: polysaccharide deacetylase family protein [Clostridiales bacterium]|jgi:peptidoglycan/xylan/chitin deacetylase (PgdA/CDA1 family)|nr:polysaccharide deacetylase family protein [Clostridiales bacterium]
MKNTKNIYLLVPLVLIIFIVSLFNINIISEQKNFTAVNTVEVEDVKLPIIMYHSVSKGRKSKYNVPPSLLESDFKYFLNLGFTPVFMHQVVDFVSFGIPLPKKPIVVTFDDAHSSVFFNAFALLKKYNIKAVINIIGKCTDGDDVSKFDAIKSHISFPQLRQMVSSGLVEVGNHSFDLHSDFGKRYGIKKLKCESEQQYKNMLKKDVDKLQQRVQDNLGIKPLVFAYPYGKYSDLAKSVLIESGLKAALLSTHQINVLNKETDLFELKRFNRPNGVSSKQFYDAIESLTNQSNSMNNVLKYRWWR